MLPGGGWIGKFKATFKVISTNAGVKTAERTITSDC